MEFICEKAAKKFCKKLITDVLQGLKYGFMSCFPLLQYFHHFILNIQVQDTICEIAFMKARIGEFQTIPFIDAFENTYC